VLVVEDDPALRRTLGLIVRGLGYEALEATDGKQALEMIVRGDAVDLVLSDVIMPKMGGYELFEKAKGVRPSLPFLFSSGYAKDSPPSTWLQEGEVAFISKPYSASELAAAVVKVLSRDR